MSQSVPFAGVRECPPWCSIVGVTVPVHQFFRILHFSLSHDMHLRDIIQNICNCGNSFLTEGVPYNTSESDFQLSCRLAV